MPNLIGGAANQVPTNGMLGSMAFQDASAVRINGGIIAALDVASLANYADDAAAAAGGIPVGGLYRTTSTLKIRVA